MGVTLIAAGLGLIGGLLAGGSIGSIKGLRPVGSWLLTAGVALVGLSRLVASQWPTHTAIALTAFSVGLGLLALGTALNSHRVPGAAIIALGCGLNLAVVLANGAMIYRQSALVSAGIVADDATDIAKSSIHGRPEEDADRLKPLGKHVALDAGFASEVVSPGDLITALGAGVMLFLALSPSKRTQTKRTQLTRISPLVTASQPQSRATPAPRQLGAPPPQSNFEPQPNQTLAQDDDAIQVLIDLTADRATEGHRYIDADELSSTMSLVDLIDPAGDDGFGPLPGETFWAARNELRAKQPV